MAAAAAAGAPVDRSVLVVLVAPILAKRAAAAGAVTAVVPQAVRQVLTAATAATMLVVGAVQQEQRMRARMEPWAAAGRAAVVQAATAVMEVQVSNGMRRMGLGAAVVQAD